MRTHAGLGTWPPELLPEVGLMQTFLCLLGRGIFEGPGFKPGGLRAPAGQGLALGFRHTITTQACVHACLVCSSHTHPSPGHAGPSPTTHISCCAPGGCSRLSYLVSVHICLSHAALLSPTQGHLRLLPDPFPAPSLEVPCPAGRVNMQWESRAVQWQVCVPWRAHSWGWPVPLCGACRVKLVS